MTKQQVQETLSRSYVEAIAAHSYCSLGRYDIDDESIDITLKYGGSTRLAASGVKYPKIDIQLKATYDYSINDVGQIPFSLDRKNYDDLRENRNTPAILVVYCMPRDFNSWIMRQSSGLTLCECGYWLNLLDSPPITRESKTVYVPTTNHFDSTTLVRLMSQAAKHERLC